MTSLCPQPECSGLSYNMIILHCTPCWEEKGKEAEREKKQKTTVEIQRGDGCELTIAQEISANGLLKEGKGMVEARLY